MEQREYEQMGIHENYYWWHVGKNLLLEVLLNKFFNNKKGNMEILEVGCGTGSILETLSKWGNIAGLDISSKAVEASRHRGFQNVICEDLLQYNTDTKYDLIVAMDVLEHIQEDVGALKKIHSLLKPNGKIIISVPVHKFLWSSRDEALHHKRRYHKVEIKQKIIDSSFKILQGSYFVFAMFFPITIILTLDTLFRRKPYPEATYIELPTVLNKLANGNYICNRS